MDLMGGDDVATGQLCHGVHHHHQRNFGAKAGSLRCENFLCAVVALDVGERFRAGSLPRD